MIIFHSYIIKGIKHIFFDLDDTLWDLKKNSKEVLLHLFQEHCIENKLGITFGEFVFVYQNQNEIQWKKYEAKQITKEEFRLKKFQNTFAHFDYNNIDMSHLVSEQYVALTPYKTHLIDGTLDVLNYLKSKYKLHLITNGFKEIQQIKLHHTGLKSFFKQIIISEEHYLSKPDIKLFQLAEQLSCSRKNECVMIGDNFENDVIGALNAGWKAIHLSPKNNSESHPSVRRIEELKELISIL